MGRYNIYDILDDIRSDRKKKVIFDTDAKNEVDDQFAIGYAMLSDERLDVLGFCAAPFINGYNSDAAKGMELCYDELLHVKQMVIPDRPMPILRGSTGYSDRKVPEHSEAVDFIIRQVRESDERVYLIATGVITNVANALTIAPDIIDKSVVVWLGTHDYELPDWNEYNLEQDVDGARLLFDCGVPVVVVPAFGSTDILDISRPELDAYLKDKNEFCSYLYEIVGKEIDPGLAARRMLFDIGATATLVTPDAVLFTVRPSPLLTGMGYSITDRTRHSVLYATIRDRQRIFSDMLTKFYTLK